MAKKDENQVMVYAVGDVGPDRADPGSMFKNVTALFHQADLVFCQLENNLSKRGTGPYAKDVVRNPETAAALKKAGFKVVSTAGNHCMEAGVDAFYDTIENLKNQDLRVLGVGKDIEEARRPVIVEIKGTRIAFLGYSSVTSHEHLAGVGKPGCAPLRAWTLYEQVEPSQPGTPGQPHTFPYPEDLSAMVEDIKKTRFLADVVIVSMHGGIHITPAVIADYQKEYAHRAIEAGADLILQHHSHILKGIEVYSGKVIFYGLGNFAIELHFMTKEWAEIPRIKDMRRGLNPDWNPPYPDYPSYPFPPDSRKTIIVKFVVSGKTLSRVSFIPAYINNNSEPEILSSNDKRFAEVVYYINNISKDQGLNTTYTIEGNEGVII
jgi:poly-gamma-glutamate capsule biosynthesis protein CapA/YwtB (metallophosphatase superfamily)